MTSSLDIKNLNRALALLASNQKDSVTRIEQRILSLENYRWNKPSLFNQRRNGGCSPLRFLVENYLESASITITPEPWDVLPTINLLITDRAKVVQFKQRETHIVDIEFDRPRLCNAFAAPYHTLSQWGLVRIQLFNDFSGNGDIVYDSGDYHAKHRKPINELKPWVDPWLSTYSGSMPHSAQHYFPLTLARSAKITLFDQDDPVNNQPMRLNMMFLGLSWSPQSNFGYGITIESDDFVTHAYSEGKTLISEGTSNITRKVSLSLNHLDDIDANLLFDFIYDVGQLKEFFFSAYPENNNPFKEMEHTFVGRFIGFPKRSHSSHNQYTTPLVIGEI